MKALTLFALLLAASSATAAVDSLAPSRVVTTAHALGRGVANVVEADTASSSDKTGDKIQQIRDSHAKGNTNNEQGPLNRHPKDPARSRRRFDVQRLANADKSDRAIWDDHKSESDLLLESTYYPVDPDTGRGPWNKIIAIGDIHGDLDQAMLLLNETGIISHQPDYYSKIILEQARRGGSFSYGEGKSSGTAGGKKKDKVKLDPLSAEAANQRKVDDGLGDFVPKDIAANMIYNKRGYIMGGATADEFHWSIGKALVVVLGDTLNVGPDDIAAVTLLRRLTREADMQGGKLVYLLGNHEVMNLRGDFSGVHPWSFERTGGSVGRQKLLSTNTAIGRFLRSRPGMFYYDNLMFMHAGLVPGAVKVVAREVAAEEGGKGGRKGKAAGPVTISGKKLADTVNQHVRQALFDAESDPSEMDDDPLASIVLNVNYDDNGKNGILLVHPIDQCDRIQKANNMTGIEAQIVGHTPVDLPHYDYCHSRLYAIDMKNSKWKGGAGALPAALVLLREEKDLALMKNRPTGQVPIPPPAATAKVGDEIIATNEESETETNSDYRWSARLVVPKVAVKQTQARVGGWTSISILGYFMWVGFLVIVCELLQFAYRFFDRRGKVPQSVSRHVDEVSSVCDIVASYMPCAGGMYARGMPLREGGIGGHGGEGSRLKAPRTGGGMYHAVNGTTDLKAVQSSPF